MKCLQHPRTVWNGGRVQVGKVGRDVWVNNLVERSICLAVALIQLQQVNKENSKHSPVLDMKQRPK
jgi:hypothetical protein